MSGPKPDTWMPFYIGDYLADTMHLDGDEHGPYLLLIFAYWRNGGPLLDDDAKLAKIARVSARRWRVLRPVISEFFTVDQGLWRHKRVDEELRNAIYRQDLQRARTAAATQARRDRNDKRDDGRNDERDDKRNGPRNDAGGGTVTTDVTRSSLPSPSPSSSLRSEESGGGSARAREEPGHGKGQAQAVLDHFLAERDRLWPNTSRQPGPHMTIRTEAQSFLDRGAPAELLREVLTRGMERTAADGKSPPSTLRAYGDSLADAVASHLKPMPEGDPLAIPGFLQRPTNGLTRDHGHFVSKVTNDRAKQAVLAAMDAEDAKPEESNP